MSYTSRFWFEKIWEANDLLFRGKINIKEYIVYHYTTTLFFYYLVFCILLILATAFLTVGERSVIADFQSRKGPRKTGLNGLLQPISDALKLLIKEKVSVIFIKEHLFSIAAWASFFVSSILWLLLPFGLETMILNFNYTSFLMFNISILHIFAIIFASWSSNSKYSILGGFRTAAQLISYELCIGLGLSVLFQKAKDLSITSYMYLNAEVAFIITAFIGIALIFFIAGLAELNRHPFDLPEAEAEPVAGYNVEYSGIRFASFFLGEYLSMIFYASLYNDIFLGASEYTIINLLRIAIILLAIIAVRALVPRYRYDQLMNICWKLFLPILVLEAFFAFFSDVYILSLLILS